MSYSVKKAGVAFKVKVNVDPDLTGKSANFTLQYYADSDLTTNLAGVVTFSEGTTPGLYISSDITVASAGDYTFNVTNTIDNLGNISSPVVVTNATIDDVKTSLTTAQGDITAIKATTDTLNTGAIDDMNLSIAAIKDMMSNKTATLTFNITDETLNTAVDVIVTGGTSGAYGTVSSTTFGTDTVVTLTNVVGTFVVGETLTGGAGTTSTVDVVTESNTSVDSVLEFVAQIDAALSDAGTGLSALEGFTDDIELMLTGTQFLQDGTTANPFYDVTNPGVATEAKLASNLTAIQLAVSNAQTAIIANNDAEAALITTAVGNVQTVVDANATSLTNVTSGLPALKTLIDTLTTNVATADGNVDTILSQVNHATYGLAAIDTTLSTMDAKLDTIVSQTASANHVQAFI